MGFELPEGARDTVHIHGDGPHVGLTRDGFDSRALDEAYGVLVSSGYTVADAAVGHRADGTYGELVVDHPLAPVAKNRLRELGFSGLNNLLH